MVVSIVNRGPIEDHRRNPARVDSQQNTVTLGNSAHRGSPFEKCGTAGKPYRVLARSSKRGPGTGSVKRVATFRCLRLNLMYKRRVAASAVLKRSVRCPSTATRSDGTAP